jgi:DNA replication and repair protein RecF
MAPANQISSWDGELVEAGNEIHAIRLRYIESLVPRLQQELQHVLPALDIELGYQRGWSVERNLAAQLEHGLESDRSLGNTRSGPHRADFSLVANGQPLQSHCSRGQQKAAIVGFMLAQVKCQQDRAAPLGAFLLDDLGSELDTNHQARVLDALRALDMQVFVTTIGETPVTLPDWPGMKRFHVEHGEIQEVV